MAQQFWIPPSEADALARGQRIDTADLGRSFVLVLVVGLLLGALAGFVQLGVAIDGSGTAQVAAQRI
jgi:hypothetical protein